MTAGEIIAQAMWDSGVRSYIHPSRWPQVRGVRSYGSLDAVIDIKLDARPRFVYRMSFDAAPLIMRCDGGDPGDEDGVSP